MGNFRVLIKNNYSLYELPKRQRLKRLSTDARATRICQAKQAPAGAALENGGSDRQLRVRTGTILDEIASFPWHSKIPSQLQMT
jgi:hypothetical protein